MKTLILAGLAGLLVASVTPACAALTSNGLTSNSLTMNGLTTNGLAANSLTANGLLTNALTINSLTFNSLTINSVSSATRAPMVVTGGTVRAITLKSGVRVPLR